VEVFDPASTRATKDMISCTRNIRSRYRAGSLTAVGRELSAYKFNLGGVKKVRWDRGGTELVGDYKFCYGNEKDNYKFGTGSFVHKIIHCSWL
jgi:hypothetical protein